MNYELALALKNTGFQQFGDGFALIPNKKLPESDETMSSISWPLYVYNPENDKKVVYAPTLEELIEACGELRKLRLIIRYPNMCRAYEKRKDMTVIKGKWYNSPVEALANLYLELKKRGGI